MNPKFAPVLVEKYCETGGYFSGNHVAVASAPPAKKSARKGSLVATKSASTRKRTKLDQYVVFDLPVNQRSEDECSVCTFYLRDEGMYDDDEASEARTLR